MDEKTSGVKLNGTGNWAIYAFIILWSALTALALTSGITYNWPDYVHVNYGLPFVWGTHTLNTIHGPVDIWNVDALYLLFDLGFWLGSMLAGVAAVMHCIKIRGTA